METRFLAASAEPGWVQSGWWDDSMWASLSTFGDTEGLAVLVAVACEMVTASSSGVRPNGIRIPCPPVKSVHVLTNQYDLAVSMVRGWSRQYNVALAPLPQVSDVELNEDCVSESRSRVFGGIAKCDFEENKTAFEGTDGRELIIAPPTWQVLNESVVLVLETESRLDPWERTNWQLKSNGTPGRLTLIATDSTPSCNVRLDWSRMMKISLYCVSGDHALQLLLMPYHH